MHIRCTRASEWLCSLLVWGKALELSYADLVFEWRQAESAATKAEAEFDLALTAYVNDKGPAPSE